MVLPESFEEFQKGGVVLSLERLRPRFEYTKRKLEAAGFTDVTFYKGLDGFEDDLEPAIQKLGLKDRFSPFIADKKGNIACTLGHILLWRKIVDENLPYLLIFEDDALPHPNFRELAGTWYKNTPKNLDLVLLGNQMNPADLRIWNPNTLLIQSPAYCLHAYAVTQEGAKRLLELVALAAASPERMKMNDMQMCNWMSKGLVNYACWNAAWIKEKGYPTMKQGLDPRKLLMENADILYERRDTGLIFQNFTLQHTLTKKEPFYMIVDYAADAAAAT